MTDLRLFYVVQVVFKSIQKSPLTASLVCIAMVVGCAGLTSVLIINDTAKKSYSNISQPLITGVSHLIVANSSQQLTQSDYSALRTQGFVNIIAAAEQQIKLNNNQTLTFLGLDYFAMLSMNVSVPDNTASTRSHPLTSTNARYLIHPQYAEQIGHDIYRQADNVIAVNGQQYGPVETFSGPGMENQIVSDIAVLYDDFSETVLSFLMVVNAEDSDDLIVTLKNALPPHLTLKPLMTSADADELTGSFHLNLLAMGLLMFVVCLFVIMNALHLLMSKRIGTYKVLRQLGISHGILIQASIIEMLILSILATVAGVPLGIGAAHWLSPAVNQTIESLYNIAMTNSDLSLASILIQSFSACVFGSLVAVSLPLHRINQNLSIASDSTLTAPPLCLWTSLAGLCLVFAILLLVSTQSLLWSFVIIALLLFGGCFSILAILPWGLPTIANLIPKHRVVLNWSVADATRISHRSSVALCAFFIAVSANIGMNLMVESFRGATQDWLQQRLDADVYIYAQEAEKIAKWLNERYPQVQTVLRQSDSGEYAGNAVQIRSFSLSSERQKAMVFDTADSDVWHTFNGEKSILINQQFALSKQIQRGDVILISRVTGEHIELPVAGIYFDYGNPELQILVPPSMITHSSNARKILAIYMSADDRKLTSEVADQTGSAFPQADVVLTGALLRLSMQTFDRTFVITSALNIITLFVAAFSLATSVLIINQENGPQRALLKSMGVTTRSLLLVELMQYCLLCLLICLLAIPFGMSLSWLLINLVNVQAFFWSYPMTVTLSTLIEVVLISLGVVIAIVAVPTVKSARARLSEEIKCLDA